MIKNPIEQTWISLREVCPVLFKKKYDKKLGYQLREGDIIKFGRVRFRIKGLGSYKQKHKSRFQNYDMSLDVSMNEKLLNDYKTKKRNTSNVSQVQEASTFQQNQTITNGEFEQENIISKLDNVSSSEKSNIQKQRQEAQ